jgi:hypothetical protein
MRTIILLGVSAALLAGCQRSGEPAADSADAAGSPAAATAPGATAAPPALTGPKPGLWRMTTRMEGLPAEMKMPAVETCVTATTFEDLQRGQNNQAGASCTQQSFRREGDAWVGKATCEYGTGMKSEISTRISGDVNSRYQMTIATRNTGGPANTMPDTNMTILAERLGDC